MIVDEQTKVIVRREEYVELQGKMQSVTDRVRIQCDVTQGGCEGEDKTYIWTPVGGQCPYQTVVQTTGSLDANNHLFVLQSILGSFNISRGIINLPEECSVAQVNLMRTQYSQLYLFIDKNAPKLKVLERDVNLEIQAKILEDAVARLQLTVGGILRQTSEVRACQA